MDDVANVAEILTSALPYRDTTKCAVDARMQRGELRRGPARLACHDGSMHAVTVLGCGMVSPPPPDPMLLHLLLDLAGVPHATIAPGQQVLQDDPDDE